MTSVPSLMRSQDWSGQRCPTGVWTSQASLGVSTLGLAAGELFGTGWQRAIHPEDLPDLLERWRSILLAGEVSAMEARLRRFDGGYHWFTFRVRPLVDASGKIVKWLGLNVDIEDRGRSGRASEGLYRSITDTIPAMISFMTPAGELESVNQHFLKYVGTTLEELKRWKIRQFSSPKRSSLGDCCLGSSDRHWGTLRYGAPHAPC